ncbi:MAG: ABC transporter permease [Gammaproteobacteria bacterium]|nr:ABC transporter permease [Gammaproteobacteria bacterium]
MSVSSWFDSVGRDVRHALRTLPRRPSFMVTAVVTLALGIGATAAIFSVVYSVLLKPLPYPNPDELVRIRHNASAQGDGDLSSASSMWFTYREESETIAELGMWGDGGETLTRTDGTERVRSLRTTYGLLQALGVQPMRGRWFTEAEHGPGAEGPDPVILSYAFAESRFGSDAAALGQALEINGRPARVVGIMPRDFRFLDMSPTFDIIVAMRLDPARQTIGTFNLHALARLKPGVTAEEARADLERMLPIWLDGWPILQGLSVSREAIENMRIRPVVRPLKDDMVGATASALWVLMAAIGAVLLVACANIANLMLVRADARRHELAVRAALGAVPARIARELLTEALVIGTVGGALGLVLAYGGLELLVAIGPGDLPRVNEIAIHPAVLAFTVAVSLLATLAFGSITALKHAWGGRVAAFDGGGGGARGASASRERSATRSTLVVVQVALALVLVVSAVLMARTFEALRNVHPGFVDSATIQTVRTWAPSDIIRDPMRYVPVQREILERIAALPGVTSVGFTNVLPMEGGPFVFNSVALVEGDALAPGDSPPGRRFKFVSPGYLETMATDLVAGRGFTWADIQAGGRVALISEDFARELGGSPADALGKRIRTPIDTDDWREVIGVVRSVKEDALYADAPSIVYWPALMANAFGDEAFAYPAIAIVVRSERTGTAALNNEIREAVWSVNRDVPVALERTMQSLYAGSLARTSFALVMLAVASFMALALGLVGIYGMMAYVVTQRSREIGIRLALGAQHREVRAMFLRQGLVLSGVGLAIGLVAALALTRFLSSLLFGVESTDLVTYTAAVAVILAAAALASYLPARRASAIDPMETLKGE